MQKVDVGEPLYGLSIRRPPRAAPTNYNHKPFSWFEGVIPLMKNSLGQEAK